MEDGCSDYYHKKIIVGRSDSRNGVIIFATLSGGGYYEYSVTGINELTDTIRQILQDPKQDYTFKDLQNGSTGDDTRFCSFYLECFPPLENRVFEYLKYKLEGGQI